MLLFHCYGGCRSSALGEARAILAMGYATLLVDFRGGGGSDGDTTTFGYNEAGDMVAAVAFARSRGLPTPLVLYGRSMGGAAILRAVGELGLRPDGVILESVFGRMIDAVRNRFALLGMPAFPGAELLLFWGGVRAGIPGFGHNPAEYAARCDCPALILHGSADKHALVTEGEAITRNLPGDKRWVAFEGAAHVPLLGADGAKWRAAVSEFLSGLRPRAILLPRKPSPRP